MAKWQSTEPSDVHKLLKVFSKKVIFNIIIALYALILFSNTADHDYCWDDKIVITENDRVKKGLTDVDELFVKYKSDLRQDKYGYRPITLLTFALDNEISELDPSVSHRANIFYFMILCLVLFHALQVIFQNVKIDFLFVVLLLFISHPLHVEVVANIKSRDEILALCFGVLSMLYLKRILTQSGWYYYVLYILTTVLAFLSRENAIIFIAIHGLIIIWHHKTLTLGLIKKMWPVAVAALPLFLLYYYASISNSGSERSEGLGLFLEDGILGNSLFHLGSPLARLANSFNLLIEYLINFLYPFDLVYYYGYNVIPIVTWSSPVVLFSLLLHIGAIIFAIKKRREFPVISFSILFYLISIAIYLHVFIVFSDTMADRFMFAPSLGLCILLVALIFRIFKLDYFKSDSKDQIVSNSSKGWIAKALIVVVILVFSAETIARNKVWENDYALVSNDIKRLDNCAKAHYHYAGLLNEQLSRRPNDKALESEMIAHYEQSISISNYSYYSFLELANYHISKQNYDQALPILREMLSLFPETADPNFYLGFVLYNQNKPSEAIPLLKKSLELSPGQIDSYNILALAYTLNKDFMPAKEIIDQGVKKFPGQEGYFYPALGQLYFDMGDLATSTGYTYQLLKLGYNPKEVYSTIIGRYQTVGDNQMAEFYYKEGLQKGVFSNQ